MVRQGWPSTELPGAGTVSLPPVIAALAAAKNAAALHAPAWVKPVNWPSLSSPATQSPFCRRKSGTAAAAGNANDPAGAAPAPLLTLPDESAVSAWPGGCGADSLASRAALASVESREKVKPADPGVERTVTDSYAADDSAGESDVTWSAPFSVRSSPLNPNQSATTALAGIVGSTGATAAVAPASITSGS